MLAADYEMPLYLESRVLSCAKAELSAAENEMTICQVPRVPSWAGPDLSAIPALALQPTHLATPWLLQGCVFLKSCIKHNI